MTPSFKMVRISNLIILRSTLYSYWFYPAIEFYTFQVTCIWVRYSKASHRPKASWKSLGSYTHDTRFHRIWSNYGTLDLSCILNLLDDISGYPDKCFEACGAISSINYAEDFTTYKCILPTGLQENLPATLLLFKMLNLYLFSTDSSDDTSDLIIVPDNVNDLQAENVSRSHSNFIDAMQQLCIGALEVESAGSSHSLIAAQLPEGETIPMSDSSVTNSFPLISTTFQHVTSPIPDANTGAITGPELHLQELSQAASEIHVVHALRLCSHFFVQLISQQDECATAAQLPEGPQPSQQIGGVEAMVRRLQKLLQLWATKPELVKLSYVVSIIWMCIQLGGNHITSVVEWVSSKYGLLQVLK